METVKVDIQKLQLLNERIAQTIDALNQVRASVHGLQQTTPIGAWGTAGLGYNPYTTGLYGQVPYVQNPFIGQNPFLAQSPYVQSPYVQSPYVQSPYVQSPYGMQTMQGMYNPLAFTPSVFPQTFVPQFHPAFASGLHHTTPTSTWSIPSFTSPSATNGLSHTAWEPRTAFAPSAF